MPTRTNLLLLSLIVGSSVSAAGRLQGGEYVLPSPSGEIELVLFDKNDHLYFAVNQKNAAVIRESPLEFSIDGDSLTTGVTFTETKRFEVNERYPSRGGHSKAAFKCVAAQLSVSPTAGGASCLLELRVADDGVAYRWKVPSTGSAPQVPAEASEFRAPEGSTVWMHGMGGHYEGVHDKKLIDEISANEWAAPPVTFKLPGGRGYASITEAALTNYSGMALQATGAGGFRIMLGPDHPISTPFRLRYEEDIERMSVPAKIVGEITTPWRVVMISEDLNGLVNCDLPTSLCAPPDRKLFPEGLHTDWVKPGRAVWRYLDGGDRSLAGMKEFARLAGQLGFEYNILEAFWEDYSEEEIRDLVDYSREQGVGLWFWKHSKQLRTPEAREEFFGNLQKWGVVGAKIDFFDHEHREVVDHYAELLQAAAEHKILVNFHGANKPTGESRTWPNELVREGVRGMESRALRMRARHDATLPFTRYLAGHADYTSTHFGSRRGDTTWTHQIASAAVFTSPLLTYAAHPQALVDNPAVEMIKSIPAVWDETHVLDPSEIGEVAVLARRSGKTWFLAAVNGPAGRTFDVPLTFLGKGDYAALLVSDQQDDPEAVCVSTATHSRDDLLPLVLGDGGGFVGRFTPRASLATAELPHSEK